MQWKAIPLLGLGLILCVGGVGCGSPSNSATGQLTINTSSLPAGTVGTAYSYSVPASGGTPPYVWSLNTGTLPVGLKLSSKGVISGTPESAGTVGFTVAVSDSEAVPASATANFSIAIQTELAVTSLAPPAGTIGISYSTTLAATGGVTPYTWTILSGSLPAGLSLGSAGVISGTPTTHGAAIFTVQVADSETNQHTAIAQLTLTINTVTITTQSLPAATVNVLYSAPLAAIGGVTPYIWTMSGALPAGLSLNSAGVITGTPTATGSSTFNVQVADSEQPPAMASAQLSITVSSSGTSVTLQGNYAFLLNGFNLAGAWTLAGSFIADGNGNITSGVVDGNSISGQPVNTAVTGIYAIASSGLNTMIIQGQSWGPMTLAFVLDSTGNGRMIEYDDTTGQGSRGSGALRKANPSAFSLGGLNGGWVFGMTGAGAYGERFVNVGQFALTTGAISDGSCDTNDGGDYETCTFTGTLSAVDPQSGWATVTVQSNNGTSHDAVYVVSTGELVMEQIDSVQQTESPLLVGSVLQQSGSFSNASLNGLAVSYYQLVNSGSGDDESGTAIISCDGNGNANIIVSDDDDAGTITQQSPSQETYTVTAVTANGSVTFTGGGNAPAGFLINQNKAFMVSTGFNPDFYWLEVQTGGPFSNASMAGIYAGGSLSPLDYTNASNEVDMGSADGIDTLTLDVDSSSSGGINQSFGNVINYNIAANGRGTGQIQGGEAPGVVYMISPTRWLVLQPTTDARVNVFQH
ncbi:MAG: Ig domain-containing protein [Candidatus Korobacteraceae bacterium]|jgi:hypothetical protein